MGGVERGGFLAGRPPRLASPRRVSATADLRYDAAGKLGVGFGPRRRVNCAGGKPAARRCGMLWGVRSG